MLSINDSSFDEQISLRVAYEVMLQFLTAYHERGEFRGYEMVCRAQGTLY